VLYVDELIGPHTVNTMPLETLAAFRDHGHVRPSLESDLDVAAAVLLRLERAGISLEAVTRQLVEDGVQKFLEPYTKLLASIEHRVKQSPPR
jgi:transaldolase